jgi:hypothetical protein
MQCLMDPADAARHIRTVPSAGKGARTPAFVNHIRTPGVFGRNTLAIRSRSPAMRSWGGHPATEEVQHEHRGDFRDGREPG